MATGGSTNAVLHLLAVAKEAGVKLTIDEFDRISRKTPLLADLKPWGSYTAPEMYEAGGMARGGQAAARGGAAPRRRADGHRPHHRRGGARGDVRRRGQKVIRQLSDPVQAQGGLAILRGNLAPDGCVAKMSGQKRDLHRGPARVFDREEDAFAAVKAGKIKAERRDRHPLGRAQGRARACARCCT